MLEGDHAREQINSTFPDSPRWLNNTCAKVAHQHRPCSSMLTRTMMLIKLWGCCQSIPEIHIFRDYKIPWGAVSWWFGAWL
eukprot:5781745-Amphidinium_carterae.1